MDKSMAYVPVNIFLTVNMSGSAAVNHTYRLLQRLVVQSYLGMHQTFFFFLNVFAILFQPY